VPPEELSPGGLISLACVSSIYGLLALLTIPALYPCSLSLLTTHSPLTLWL